MISSRLRCAYTLVAICLLLVGCATLTTEFDPPKVTVENVRSIPSEGMEPRFEFQLRVANPNKQSLDIAGISYTIELMGKELISGVTNEVPQIAGYSEEVVTVQASVNTFQLLRLLAELGKSQADSLDYRFAAKIDFHGFIPTQRVEETGTLSL